MTATSKPTTRPRRLICCCCDGPAIGRQWWNRDTGYGLCDDCIPFATRNMSAEDARQCYGEKGVHYGLEPKASKPEKPQHTRGKWHLGAGNGEGSIFADKGRGRLESGGTTLYPICQVTHGWDEAEDNANARLIAAAPSLLKALEGMLEWARRMNEPNPGPEIYNAHKALGEAIGKGWA